MTAPDAVQAPLTAEDWQSYLDTKFPEGAQINAVEADGSLAPTAYNVPYLAVLGLDGEWPVLRGIHLGTDYTVDVAVSGWEEIDRSGHFVARVASGAGRFLEFSSWLSDPLTAQMATVRAEHQEVLGEQVALIRNDAARAAGLPVESASAEVSEEAAPQGDLPAEPEEDVR